MSPVDWGYDEDDQLKDAEHEPILGGRAALVLCFLGEERRLQTDTDRIAKVRQPYDDQRQPLTTAEFRKHFGLGWRYGRKKRWMVVTVSGKFKH